jgi:hypothetical protein
MSKSTIHETKGLVLMFKRLSLAATIAALLFAWAATSVSADVVVPIPPPTPLSVAQVVGG